MGGNGPSSSGGGSLVRVEGGGSERVGTDVDEVGSAARGWVVVAVGGRAAVVVVVVGRVGRVDGRGAVDVVDAAAGPTVSSVLVPAGSGGGCGDRCAGSAALSADNRTDVVTTPAMRLPTRIAARVAATGSCRVRWVTTTVKISPSGRQVGC